MIRRENSSLFTLNLIIRIYLVESFRKQNESGIPEYVERQLVISLSPKFIIALFCLTIWQIFLEPNSKYNRIKVARFQALLVLNNEEIHNLAGYQIPSCSCFRHLSPLPKGCRAANSSWYPLHWKRPSSFAWKCIGFLATDR